MTRIVWKLRDYLHARNIRVQDLARAMDGKRVATLYRLTSPTDPPSRVDLPTLEVVIGTLRRMTGEHVDMSDVFEVVEVSLGSDDRQLWHDAELHPGLEPDAHSRLEPDTLGEAFYFEPGRGWVGGEDS